ncbi:MAG: DUF898 domain-containing protein [Campylobacteraceae bacterium]|nr:DUF898 domain-containing protein [Campylobacteraceae bacterium]
MQENIQVLKNTPFEFRGNALDFFKIWFVNVVLTIITLGIYGAWAKVRNNQYIYGNTYLGDHAFEYTANPIRILIGRLIVVGFYILYFVAAQLGFWVAAGILLVAFLLLLPLLIRQALVFRAKYTRFHGLSFKYKASIGDFYGFFLLHGFLNLITIGIIFPYTHNRFKKLVINNTYYGDSSLSYNGGAPEFFFIYYIKMALLNIVFIVVGAVFIAITQAFMMLISSLVLIYILIYILILLYSFVIKGAFDAWIGRAVYNETSIKEYKMLNEWSVLKLSWIYFSNFFAMLFSLGLLYPWAKIRTAKYKLENIGFEELDLRVFAGQTEQNRSAVGEETADFFDFDIGF